MNEIKRYRGFRDLIVYQKSYRLALDIFEITMSFPREEKYALVDQIRRSSRSVPANISEAWFKRRYPKSFISKLVDVAGETGETEVWLDFAKDHSYIQDETYTRLINGYSEINRMPHAMIQQPEKFCY